MIKTIDQLQIRDKKVLVRCDFNVPIKDGVIQDDTRIREAMPTINELLSGGSSVILMSHLGRPKGQRVPEMSLEPVAKKLGELTGIDVRFSQDAVGDEAAKNANNLNPGEILLLENLRFYPEEKENDPGFAGSLAGLADVFVQDAFGTVHRSHASMVGVPEKLDAAAGRLLEKEIKYLSMGLKPEKPFVVILGGAKLETKIPIIDNMMEKADVILIGGGMAYTLLKVQGIEIGKSLVDNESLAIAETILKKATEKSVDLELPTDHVITDDFDSPNKVDNIAESDIPYDMMGVDIGQETAARYTEKIKNARTIVFNGPMGVFEKEEFSSGTKTVIQAVMDATANGASSIVGGGDTVSAITNLGFSPEGFTHISTGGGASLKFLEGKELPGIKILDK